MKYLAAYCLLTLGGNDAPGKYIKFYINFTYIFIGKNVDLNNYFFFFFFETLNFIKIKIYS